MSLNLCTIMAAYTTTSLFSVLTRKQQRLWRGGGRRSVGECRGVVYVPDEAVPHPGFLHVQKEGQSVTDRARQNREQDRGTDERKVQKVFMNADSWIYNSG